MFFNLTSSKEISVTDRVQQLKHFGRLGISYSVYQFQTHWKYPATNLQMQKNKHLFLFCQNKASKKIKDGKCKFSQPGKWLNMPHIPDLGTNK